MEESILAQKSRVKWLAEGDQNTRFFHNSIKTRINKNKFVSLTLEDGSFTSDVSIIKQQVVSHFSSLLGPDQIPYPGKSSFAPFVSKRIEPQHVEALDSEVTSEEIKSALFSIHPNKAPGPDGFNGFFFQQVWHIIGDHFVAAIKYFFSSGRLLREVNSTIIALIPKSKNPSCLNDYRPISCCNTIYKCISKILANRLKGILPAIIDNAQSAFIRGRSISDNILLTQELLHNYHRKDTSARCAIKADILKAFDSVHWEFLWDLLDCMAFPP